MGEGLRVELRLVQRFGGWGWPCVVQRDSRQLHVKQYCKAINKQIHPSRPVHSNIKAVHAPCAPSSTTHPHACSASQRPRFARCVGRAHVSGASASRPEKSEGGGTIGNVIERKESRPEKARNISAPPKVTSPRPARRSPHGLHSCTHATYTTYCLGTSSRSPTDTFSQHDCQNFNNSARRRRRCRAACFSAPHDARR